MRVCVIVVAAASSCLGCQIEVLGDFGSEPDPWCVPASCSDQARLFVEVPMEAEQARRTDLWLSVCHAGKCETEVHLEWSCESSDAWCALECAASSKVLGGAIEVRRGGSCGSGNSAAGLCVELSLPADGLVPGSTEVTLVLDDAVSGRRVLEGAFAVELAEHHTTSCGSTSTCLKGETRAFAAPFAAATAASGAHALELAAPSVSISAADRHTCGTRADGSLACWGNLPGPDQQAIPSGSFQRVATGALQDCALGLDGIVTCFGNESLAGRALEPPPGVFREIAVGPAFGCGVRPSGRVECWGDDACRLPRGLTLSEVTHVVASASGTTLCALGSGGSAECTGDWNRELRDTIAIGANAAQLCRLSADGSAHCTRADTEIEIADPGPYVDLAVGEDHACGLAHDGRVTCFGTNAALVSATPAAELIALTSSSEHVCGITTAATVVCWGDDEHGQASPPPGFP